MFGMSFEKLLLVAVLAAVVVGPRRLPDYARLLGHHVRTVRRTVDQLRAEVRAETDTLLGGTAWPVADLSAYDPRRIVREAWDHDPVAASHHPEVLAQAARIEPGQRYLVTGSAAHPTRVLLSTLPADDPRRVAAEPREPLPVEPAAAGGTPREDPVDDSSADGRIHT